ncbi:MAG: hypothetical protein GY859_17355 [Desulfobacterales bacterium]|nr:hypothetical protein [Desulfobacterales bacterium]
MAWTVENSKLPEAGVWSWVMKDGGLLGVAVSGHQHGYESARMGVRILKGTKPSDIKIRVPEKGDVVVNKTRFRDLGIYMPLSLLRRTIQYK